MATQVEALLPGNPLAKAEERDKVIRGEPEEEEEEEEGDDDGAKQQTGVADSSSRHARGETTGAKERTSKQTVEQDRDGCDSGDKHDEDSLKEGGGKKEFTEAPPPKVNPWTRKMNAVTVVSVNGQAHHGLYPPSCPSTVLSALSVQVWSPP